MAVIKNEGGKLVTSYGLGGRSLHNRFSSSNAKSRLPFGKMSGSANHKAGDCDSSWRAIKGASYVESRCSEGGRMEGHTGTGGDAGGGFGSRKDLKKIGGSQERLGERRKTREKNGRHRSTMILGKSGKLSFGNRRESTKGDAGEVEFEECIYG